MNQLLERPTDQYLRNVDTVFLFGAGTSAHMKLSQSKDSPSAPTDASFFDTVKDGILERWCTNPSIIRIAGEARNRVFHALRNAGMKKELLFTQSGGNGPVLGLEELFCKLEMLRMLGRYVTPGKTDNEFNGRWNHPAEALRDLIAIVMSHGRPAPDVEYGYAEFAGRILLSQRKKSADTYAVLSLNYEVGLERAIRVWYETDARVFAQTRELAASLGVPGSVMHWLVHYALPHREILRTREAVPVLKLHGSCNWGYCPQCENVAHLPVELGAYESMVERLVERF